MTKPLLFNVVNSLYNTAQKLMPEFLRERPMFMAFGMAAAGTYLLARAAQWTSKNIAHRIIPEFDEKYLPKLEKACKYGIPAAVLVYYVIDPQGAQETLMNHPVYTSGMTGVYVGGLKAANQDLKKRSEEAIKKESLEHIVK